MKTAKIAKINKLIQTAILTYRQGNLQMGDMIDTRPPMFALRWVVDKEGNRVPASKWRLKGVHVPAKLAGFLPMSGWDIQNLPSKKEQAIWSRAMRKELSRIRKGCDTKKAVFDKLKHTVVSYDNEGQTYNVFHNSVSNWLREYVESTLYANWGSYYNICREMGKPVDTFDLDVIELHWNATASTHYKGEYNETNYPKEWAAYKRKLAKYNATAERQTLATELRKSIDALEAEEAEIIDVVES